MTPFDQYFKGKELRLNEKFGSLVAEELRQELYWAFEFGASVGYVQGLTDRQGKKNKKPSTSNEEN